MRRRTAVAALIAVAVTLLLGWYIAYTQRVVRQLQGEAQRSSRMFSRIFEAQSDSSESASARAMIDLVTMIREEANVPLILTSASGAVSDSANVPDEVFASDESLRAYIRDLDEENPPVKDNFGNTVHYGSTQMIRSLRVVPLIQSVLLGTLILVAAFLLRTYYRAEREKMWAGMARESAHQIGTPLSSMHGWVEVLRERAGDPLVDKAISNMQGDIERLERVSHRFERIGRPPKLEPVDANALVQRIVSYFSVRVPSLATPVKFAVDLPADPITVGGDKVLLEWVLESLVKNAVDALSGVGGTITLSATALPDSRIRLRVADTGPGVPPNLRSKIFDAGFSTKERGWGIGLALTKRIVEQNHAGKLLLSPSEKGAVFDVILPA